MFFAGMVAVEKRWTNIVSSSCFRRCRQMRMHDRVCNCEAWLGAEGYTYGRMA